MIGLERTTLLEWARTDAIDLSLACDLRSESTIGEAPRAVKIEMASGRLEAPRSGYLLGGI